MDFCSLKRKRELMSQITSDSGFQLKTMTKSL